MVSSERGCDDTRTVHASSQAPHIINRRNFLKTSAVGSVGLLAGCLGQKDQKADDGEQNDKSEEGETLRVSVWSGQYADFFENSIKPMYEEETNETLEIIPGWDNIIANIRSSPEDDPPYDVTVTEGLFYQQARNENLFFPIREDNIPNLEEVYPYVKDLKTTEYGVPIDAAPVAIIFNNDLIDYEIDSWQSLINEQTRMTLEGGFYAYVLHIGAILLDERPGVKEIYDPDYHDAVFDAVTEFNAAAWYGTGAERWQHLQQQIAHAAQSYFGVSVGRGEENDWMSISLPEETTGYYNHYGVVRGTNKRDLAEHFLNFMLREDVQTKWGETSHQLLANQNATHSERALEAGFPTTNKEYQNFHFPDYEALEPYSADLSERYKVLQMK